MTPQNPPESAPVRHCFAISALAIFALAATALTTPQTAKADPRYDHRYRDHRDYHHPDPRYRRGYYGRGPDVIYAPPPVVYRPEPSPGISLILPINIR